MITNKTFEKQLSNIEAGVTQILKSPIVIKHVDKSAIHRLTEIRSDVEQRFNHLKNREHIKIAIVGTMKSGKSTLLNRTIFGKSILPTDTTPSTSVPTRILYDPNLAKKATVIFYTKDEWEQVKKIAETNNIESDKKEAAKDLYEKAKNLSHNDLSDMVGTNIRVSIDDIADYVSSSGRYTCITKEVIIYTDNETLKYVELLDTGGLCDPVVSRSESTKKYLSKCDIVLFCSPADQFLKLAEVDALIYNLPSQGIGKIYLLCTRFDDALLDWYNEGTFEANFQKACEKVASIKGKATLKLTEKHATEPQILSNISQLQDVDITTVSMCLEELTKNTNEGNMKNACDNMRELYPNADFSVYKSILPKFHDIIKNSYEKKESIRDAGVQNFIDNISTGFNHTIDEIIRDIKQEISFLKNNDPQTLQRSFDEITAYLKEVEDTAKPNLIQSLNEYKKEVIGKLDSAYKDAIKEANNSRSPVRTENVSVQKTGVTYERRWYTAWLWKHKITYTYLEHEVRSWGSVSNVVEKCTLLQYSVNNKISKIVESDVSENSLKLKIFSVFGNIEQLEAVLYILRKTIDKAVESFVFTSANIVVDTKNITDKFGTEEVNQAQISELDKLLVETMQKALSNLPPKLKEFENEFSIKIEYAKKHVWSEIDRVLQETKNDLQSKLTDKENLLKELETVLQIINSAKS